MNWWQLDIQEVFEKTGSSENGLPIHISELKRGEYGLNELEVKKRKPPFIIFVNQFKDFMILVLIAAAVISGVSGELTDTIIILIIVILNAVIGFFQEYNAERAMEALKKISALKAKVIREGHSITIPSSELVPGDVVILEAGNIVPADLRLYDVHNLNVNESALTGESVPVEKFEKVIGEENLPAGDRLNMAFKSTLVTKGRSRGIVVGTGMNTEIGRIAGMLQIESDLTPLQKRMTDFSKKLSYIIILICAMFFAIGYLRKEDVVTMLATSISLAVAAIPEALPALITVALAGGAKRMVRKNALIRKLTAVETLGSVTYICSDKTGTLTLNKMEVVQVEAFAHEILHDEFSVLECCMVLNNDVTFSKDKELSGEPTETALVGYFLNNHSVEEFKHLRNLFKRVAELPFDSNRKCMTTAHRYNEKVLVITKGAVENIIDILKDHNNKEEILNLADLWATKGMRVMAYGYRIVDFIPEPIEDAESELLFAGLAGMIDPPREEASQSIEQCKTAGIQTVMITGDHPATASEIARQLGILSGNEEIISGRELQELNDIDFDSRIENIRVYARVSPEQKLRIVKTLKSKNHFVAVTGDGVNDAPSLKAADIGVAMGINGTDVSKEASDMVLLDDNFATIVNAVKEGRKIYDNIRKFVKYIMTCNSAEILTMFCAPFFGLPIPLLPIHILWINLVTDGLPGLALANEKPEKDIMKRPPRSPSESLFAGGTGSHIIVIGILMAGITLGVQAWAVYNNNPAWQTMVFAVLSFSQLAHVLAIRSERQYLFKVGLFSNPLMLGAVAFTFILQLMIIYLPFANTIFKTQPLSIHDLLVCIVLSLMILIAVESEKYFRKRFTKITNN